MYKRDVLSVLDSKYPFDYNSSTKQAIKQAEALSLEVKEVEEIKSFWNELLIPNLEKRHKTRPVHSISEMEKLKQLFPFNIRQFNVYNNETLIAGCTVFETKTTAHVQYIAGVQLNLKE